MMIVFKLSVIMMNVFKLSVIMINIINAICSLCSMLLILTIILLIVILLSVVVLSVTALFEALHYIMLGVVFTKFLPEFYRHSMECRERTEFSTLS